MCDNKDELNRQILLNSQFNVIQLSDACLGFDVCCGLTPITPPPAVTGMPAMTRPSKGSYPCGQILVAHCWQWIPAIPIYLRVTTVSST